MGRISKRHQQELDAIAKKAIETWQWELGTDVNPARVEREELDDAYEAVREAIRYDLDGIAKRAGTVGHSEAYLRGSVFPSFWKILSQTGVFLDFEALKRESFSDAAFGDIRPATPTDLRQRLFRSDQESRFIFNKWQATDKEVRKEKRDAKQSAQMVWNAEVFEEMNDLASRWLEGKASPKNIKEDLAQRLIAIVWFTGRRAWIEAATGADFQLAEGDPWADGWISFVGRGKRTLAEKEGAPEEGFTIPLFGIESEVFLEGFREFREMESHEPWFRPEVEDRNEYAKQALEYNCQGLLAGPVAQIFKPVTDAGYELAFTDRGRAKSQGIYTFNLKSFRQLYASQGFETFKAWAMENGVKPGNINGYAKRYIGHFGLRSEQDTAEYLTWTYLGDRDIPALQG